MQDVCLKVSFYNEQHRALLKANPLFSQIETLTEKGINCTREDFWTYSLYKEAKPFPGYRNFQELKHRLPNRIDKINEYFNEKSNTIQAVFSGAQNQEFTEEVGVAGALTTISHIHALAQSDWYLIPPSKNKDLDFSSNPRRSNFFNLFGKDSTLEEAFKFPFLCSDGERFIEVEAKGAYVDEDTLTPISSRKYDIEEKKHTQRNSGNSSLMYGVITSYSEDPGIIAHCRILDPPPILQRDISPRKARLLSRLNFYLDTVRLFSRANYLVALATRIGAINAVDSYENLDSQPLLNSNGEEFQVDRINRSIHTFIEVESQAVFGEVAPINSPEETESVRYLFFGLDFSVLGKVLMQNFSDVIDYRCLLPPRFSVSVDAKVLSGELRVYGVDDSGFRNASQSRVFIPLTGVLHSNSAGIVWGFLRRES